MLKSKQSYDERSKRIYSTWKEENVDNILKMGLSPLQIDGILLLAFWGGWLAALKELEK